MSDSYEDFRARIEAERKAKAAEADEGRLELASKLFRLGVTHVTIAFSGSGDSGNFDDIDIIKADGTQLVDDAVRNEVEAWADTYLEGTGVDWYNNDGGQGEIKFDLTTAPFHFTAYVDQNETIHRRMWEEESGA